MERAILGIIMFLVSVWLGFWFYHNFSDHWYTSPSLITICLLGIVGSYLVLKYDDENEIIVDNNENI